MDITNLVGALPPTDDTVYAKNLKTSIAPREPNWFVARWMELRTGEYGFVIFFVNVPLRSLLIGRAYPMFLLMLIPWLYLEGSAQLYWHPDLGRWFFGFFAKAETPIPPYAEAVKALQDKAPKCAA